MNRGAFRFSACLTLLSAWGLLTGACAPPAEQHPDGNSINFNQALELSNRVANDMVHESSKDLFSIMDPGFMARASGPKDVQDELNDIYRLYGRPVLINLKASQPGYRVDGLVERPKRSFWYACETTKYPMGKYFLKVEVVPDRIDMMRLETSGFGLITYPKGIPYFLQ
jgi:hypothetical protein